MLMTQNLKLLILTVIVLPRVAGTTCTDSRTSCVYWQQRGLCTGAHLSDYVRSICQRSCNVDKCADLPYTDNSVELTTTRHVAVEDHVTEHVSLSCKHVHDRSDMDSLVNLTLYKVGVEDRYIAHLDSSSPNGVSVQNSLGGEPSGQLVIEGDSFLTYTWPYPSNEIAGGYKCMAVGSVLDNPRHLVRSYDEEAVPEIRNDVNSLLKRMQKMAKKLTGGVTCDEQESIKIKSLNVKLEERERIIYELNITTWPDAYKWDLQLREIEELNVTGLTEADKLAMVQQFTEFDGFKSRFSYKGHEYLISHNDMDWNAITFQKICRVYGGYMMEINDEEEWDFVFKTTKENAMGLETLLGVTGTDKNTWEFMTSRDPVTFTNWSRYYSPKNEPNCATYTTKCCRDEWSAERCVVGAGKKANFVCEIP